MAGERNLGGFEEVEVVGADADFEGDGYGDGEGEGAPVGVVGVGGGPDFADVTHRHLDDGGCEGGGRVLLMVMNL